MSDPDSSSSIADRVFKMTKMLIQGFIKFLKSIDKVASGLVSIKDKSIMAVMKEGIRVINEAYDDTFRDDEK